MQTAARSTVAVIVLALGMAGAAQAGSLQDGTRAYNRGNYPQAIRMLVPLARHGNARAQTMLGFMYAHGNGVPQDFVLAAKWYRRAAEQGNSTAQYMLGLLYDKGHGVELDFIEAHKWLNLAAAKATGREREFSLAMRNAIASKLSLAQIAEAQRRAREWRPVVIW